MGLKKTSYIFLGIIILVIVVSVLYFSSQKTQKTPADTKKTASVQIPSPYLPKEYKWQFPVNINIKPENMNVPNKAMVYEIQEKPISFEELSKIAKTLGFNTQNYRLTEDKIMGKTYSYSEENKVLRIVPSHHIIDYKILNKFPNNSTIEATDENTIVDLAKNFIVDNNLISNPENLFFTKIQFFYLDEMGHISDETKANVVRVTFTKKINNYDLISPSFETGSASVLFNSNKEPVFVYIDDSPEVKNYKEYLLKNIDEIKSEIQNYSTLKSVNKGLISPLEIDEDSIIEANIDSIEIAYTQELNLKQKYLQPVFVLSGYIKTKDRGDVEATLLLPSISDTNYNP